MRVLAVLCLTAVAASACSGERPVLVREPRPEQTAPPVAEQVVDTASDAPLADAGSGEAVDPTDGGPVVRVGVVGSPVLDPVLVSAVDPTGMAVLDLVTDGLTEWDPQRNTWAPALADDVWTDDGGRSWRFTLDGASFSDGTAIRADDVVRSFERVLGDGLSLPATRLEMVDAIVAVDPTTVAFELSEPFAAFPALVSSPLYGIVPGGPVDGRVTSGPFRVAGDGRLVSDRFAHAFHLVSIANEASAVEAFRRGDLDVVFVSAGHVGPTTVSVASAVEIHYALNASAPVLADVEHRRAVVDAVSRTRVTEAAFGEGAGAIGRLVPAALACAAPCGGDQPEEAADLGPISLVYVAEPTGREEALADAVVGELADAGIDAVATGLTLDDFVDQVSAGEHEMVRTGWVGLFPSADSQLAPYRSTSPDNVAGFSSGTFDDLLTAARTTGGASLHGEAQAMLQDEAVVLPVARLRVRALVSDRIASIELRHDGSIDLDSLRLAN
ncbi:MAG: ABC transporter substrate-binding protein [Actinomycetota bacterium]